MEVDKIDYKYFFIFLPFILIKIILLIKKIK